MFTHYIPILLCLLMGHRRIHDLYHTHLVLFLCYRLLTVFHAVVFRHHPRLSFIAFSSFSFLFLLVVLVAMVVLLVCFCFFSGIYCFVSLVLVLFVCFYFRFFFLALRLLVEVFVRHRQSSFLHGGVLLCFGLGKPGGLGLFGPRG